MCFIQNHWKASIEEFELAVNTSPKYAEYLRALGWALFNGGDKLSGFERLHRANELAPSSINID